MSRLPPSAPVHGQLRHRHGCHEHRQRQRRLRGEEGRLDRMESHHAGAQFKSFVEISTDFSTGIASTTDLVDLATSESCPTSDLESTLRSTLKGELEWIMLYRHTWLQFTVTALI